jgi:bifunctional non-homologous end joining protein LigD
MAGLKTYNAKRRFDVTPEPRGKKGRDQGNAFVIQKHDATRLHYDFRIELDGVMKSWAVTRGPSLNPDDKRLAVHVEDHPLEYNSFEGTIPEGEYGGGTVMIWDRGRWVPEEDAHQGYAKGHLSFRLEGKKLQGLWHLVRMKKRAGETRENWLLIKSHDEFARGSRGPDILEEMPLSVASGRSMEEIAKAKGKVWHSNKAAKNAPAPRAKTKGSKKASAPAKPAARPRSKAKAKKSKRKSGKADTDTVPGARPGTLPDFVPPCLATLSVVAPRDPSWLHEIKLDGYRVQARIDRGRVALLTRKGLDWSDRFPGIAAALETFPAETALLDGEIVSLGDDGHSSFSQLQQDLKDGRDDRMVYYVFDLLHLDGEDLRPATLEARKGALAQLVDTAEGPVRLSESFDEEGPVLHRHACELGLEGIISKRRDAAYHSGRGTDWIKTKCTDRQELVVAGYTNSTADPRAVGALALSYYEDGKLTYAGRTGTGFSRQSSRELWNKLQPLRVKKSPFGVVPDEERGVHGAQWVEPKIVVEVDFHGWTHGGRVRQASFQGVREDKSPSEVVREKKVMAASSEQRPAHSKRSTPKKAAKAPPRKVPLPKARTLEIEGVTLTHPDRIYWEDAGVTKQHLADYYTQVWDWMRPHVTGRVLALLRCPQGANAQCFFQKHVTSGIDEHHLHLVREPDGDTAIAVDNLDGLIALVQGAVLEIHVRGSSIERLEDADRLVFDLDPGPGIVWSDLVAAAREVRERLAALELESFVKTTGGKGLHVVLPIRPTPWDAAKAFCRRIAEAMATESPKRYTAVLKKTERSDRIFIDYLRNSREATAVAPYSTRARPGASVSVPITWDELKSLRGANQYTVLNLAQRLKRLRKDPWAEIGKLKQALPKPSRKR